MCLITSVKFSLPSSPVIKQYLAYTVELILSSRYKKLMEFLPVSGVIMRRNNLKRENTRKYTHSTAIYIYIPQQCDSSLLENHLIIVCVAVTIPSFFYYNTTNYIHQENDYRVMCFINNYTKRLMMLAKYWWKYLNVIYIFFYNLIIHWNYNWLKCKIIHYFIIWHKGVLCMLTYLYLWWW